VFDIMDALCNREVCYDVRLVDPTAGLDTFLVKRNAFSHLGLCVYFGFTFQF